LTFLLFFSTLFTIIIGESENRIFVPSGEVIRLDSMLRQARRLKGETKSDESRIARRAKNELQAARRQIQTYLDEGPLAGQVRVSSELTLRAKSEGGRLRQEHVNVEGKYQGTNFILSPGKPRKGRH
jgi:hypothetical protein